MLYYKNQQQEKYPSIFVCTLQENQLTFRKVTRKEILMDLSSKKDNSSQGFEPWSAQ